ncbi:VC_2705 family sodium/solute symporter [Roseateles sp. BYS180W]|uniref:VC_2705 family sodium/solute symporter n=1 Tax=Roseateles rivi TaxID=3299028 RepID=A0ABW7FVW9_9BURK
MYRAPESMPRRRIHWVYLSYCIGLLALVGVLALLEQWGMPKRWIGFCFLAATVLVYASIGVACRSTDPDDYYVAGRRVPAFFNGMATSADWMSAASFLGMSGTLYLLGYGGLAFVLGWTGGFCLVALLIAPYLRRHGQYTVPDFLGARFGSDAVRLVAAGAAVLVSFVYVVAQLYGVGLITMRLTGLSFEIGLFVGLGGVLVCSFLGGMRAVTWTQVAQYTIMILAYLLPVLLLSVKQTGTPWSVWSYAEQLQAVQKHEQQLIQNPAEQAVRALHAQQAREQQSKLEHVPQALAVDRLQASERVSQLKSMQASLAEVQVAEKHRASLPRTEAQAQEQWRQAQLQAQRLSEPLSGMPLHTQAFEGDPKGNAQQRELFERSRLNFVLLVLCLMVGTAGMPHILTRYLTTPSVAQTRSSVAWSMLLICLLYVTAPALAVMLKLEVFGSVVGLPMAELPQWMHQWMRTDQSLLSVQDLNGDGVLQFGELHLSGDIVMLLLPELSGLPYVVSGLVAAGGLAAALSTADGLLLTISSAFTHDTYHRVINPKARATRRVMMAKSVLLMAAVLAATVAAHKPADILQLVGYAFSIAGATFVPALVLGIFWSRATWLGALCAMLSGLGLTLYYLASQHRGLRQALGVSGDPQLWWGVAPMSAGVFGVVCGVLVLVLVSLAFPAARGERQRATQFLAQVRGHG